ncbi:glycosyltransferase family 8 protein [Brachyspira pulli]|uniref:glycosyltransferase family 8 protein n=1 Tax=Brachyspira pulli TaxID=310721 RepID=UPI003007C5E5
MNEINICFSSDNNYAIYMGNAIISILVNADKDDELYFHILDGGISEENKKKIDSLKEIKDFKIKYYIPDTEKYEIWRNNITDKLEKADYISKAAFYRLEIPNILKHLDKVLYLDCDLIIRKSLKELFSIDVDNYCIAARRYSSLANSGRFNSGVMLINCKKWSDSNDIIEKKIYEHYISSPALDETLLNRVFENNIKVFEAKYNFLAYGDWAINDLQVIKDKENIHIIHYVGRKPWNLYSKSVFMQDEYWKYFFMSPWFKENPSYYISFMIRQEIKNARKDIIDYIEERNNRIKLFGIYNYNQYFRIIFFGIRITFIKNKIINSIAWWIPVRKWRDDFRYKYTYRDIDLK